jgi:superfamily II DNA or RNA helicase
MASNAASRASKPFDLIIWLANTKEQVEQAHAAIANTVWPHPVIFRVKCVAGRPDVSEADILIVDECHHLPAMTWSETVINAKGVIWGFSATPWSGDWERDESLKGFFGEDNFITIPRAEVLDGGSITSGFVHIHDLDTEMAFQAAIDEEAHALVLQRKKRWRMIPVHELQRRALWEVTQKAVRANPARNDRIVALAQEGAGILILVGEIEHGKALAERIPGSVVVYSAMGAQNRRQAIADARSGKLRVMIATSLADEGLDVPRLSTLINAAGGRSASKLEQRAGRVMRPFADKLRGVVHDFMDRGASLALAQAKARIRTYKKLGYHFQA